jgi:phage baseplate assembly protein W
MASESSQDFLGSGWSFPPSFSAQGRELTTISGPDNVHKSIWIILNTRLGERIMQEDFGAGLQNLHFEPLNARLVNNLKRMIRNTLLLHESRITLDDLTVTAKGALEGTLLIELHYTVKSTNSRFNLVFPFYIESNTKTT